ncbi:uncharacterized protein LOC144157684 [Haemaphysalis longicornis]
MAELPELQRSMLARSRALGYEPYADAPARVRNHRSRASSDSDSDDGDLRAPAAHTAREDPGDEPDPARLGNAHWCTCGLCVAMPTLAECVCCREIPEATAKQAAGCITAHPHFHTLCLDEVVLDVAYLMLRQHGVRVERTKKYRYISFSQLAHWLWGYLGLNNRKVLPACAVTKIRETFPSAQYTGFRHAQA